MPASWGSDKVHAGAPGAPGLSFWLSPATGLYQPSGANNYLGIATAGVGRWVVDNGGNLSPVSDNAVDIGAPAPPAAIRDLYINGKISWSDGVDSATNLTPYGSAASFTATSTNPGTRQWNGNYLRQGKLITVFLVANLVAPIAVGAGSYQWEVPSAYPIDITIHPVNSVLGVCTVTAIATNYGGFSVRVANANLVRVTANPSGTVNASNPQAPVDPTAYNLNFSYITP